MQILKNKFPALSCASNLTKMQNLSTVSTLYVRGLSDTAKKWNVLRFLKFICLANDIKYIIPGLCVTLGLQ